MGGELVDRRFACKNVRKLRALAAHAGEGAAERTERRHRAMLAAATCCSVAIARFCFAV